MTSAYLDKPIRTLPRAIADIIANMKETFIVVDMARGEPYLREADLGQSFDAVVRDLAAGQYDFRSLKTNIIESPVAILRISNDAPVENVTEKIAAAVLAYLEANDKLYDEEGFLVRCPFLDTAWPQWEYQVRTGKALPPEYEHEEFLEKQEGKLA